MFFLVLLVILLIIYIQCKFLNVTKLPNKIQYSVMTHDDVDEIHSMEIEAYNTIDEVPCKFHKHSLVNDCPELCMVARDENGKIIGALYSGLIKGPSITIDKISMGHDPEGDTLFVYSMYVSDNMRGSGIGREMGRYYYDEWLNYGDKIKYASYSVRRRHLRWSKDLGFSYVGLSDVKAGNEPWFDVMKKIQK
jgi:GNAT superfamily N-acetyltransferase